MGPLIFLCNDLQETRMRVMKRGYILNKDIDVVLFFFVFLGLHPWHIEVPRLGINQNCSHQPTPQSQQHQIQAVSATYNTAPGNTGSLTHWARPGVESTSSWMLVEFVNHWTTPGTYNLLKWRFQNHVFVCVWGGGCYKSEIRTDDGAPLILTNNI